MTTTRSSLFAIFLSLALSCWGCQGADQPSRPTGNVDAANATNTPSNSQESVSNVFPREQSDDLRVAASHILVAYQGATGSDSQVHRTRAEARRLAEDLLQRVLKGEDFESLAREYSDGPSAVRGGFLGGFSRGTMAQAFEDAVFSLPIGGISQVVETPFGFHVIRRENLEEAHVSHILIQWKGLDGSKARRSRAEALTRAQEAASLLQAGDSFDDVARKYSDGAMASRGGDLGWIARGQLLPGFEEAAFALEPGQVSEIVETPAGFHLIKRLE